MSKTPTYAYRTFIWREMSSPDVAASKRFYGEVFGWSFTDMPMGEFTYTMIGAGERGVGGMTPLDPSTGAPPSWISTISVEDTDASAKAAVEAGGTVVVPPGDIEGYGRFALVTSTDGTLVSLMHQFDGDHPVDRMPTLGEFCWEHLNTANLEASKGFYSKVFGWEVGTNEGGLSVLKLGEKTVASITPAEGGAPSHWLTYVVVDDLAAARARVVNNGGTVLAEEHAVPGIGRFAVVTDNVGAMICPFQPAG